MGSAWGHLGASGRLVGATSRRPRFAGAMRAKPVPRWYPAEGGYQAIQVVPLITHVTQEHLRSVIGAAAHVTGDVIVRGGGLVVLGGAIVITGGRKDRRDAAWPGSTHGSRAGRSRRGKERGQVGEKRVGELGSHGGDTL